MKIIEHIKNANKKTLLSFEILPPLRGTDISSLFDLLNPLVELKPSFINVTYHRSEFVYKRNSQGFFDKIETRKRPGTVGICASILNRYKVDPVPHIICGGFTKMETEDALIDLHYLGVDNALVLRGDAAKGENQFTPEPLGNTTSLDLFKQVANLNQGIFLEDEIKNGLKTNFCIGASCYPEKHIESPNIDSDIEMLKKKIDLGAEYCISQMFFDNKKYFDYVEKVRKAGITIPIIPGLKPITSTKQLFVIPKVFNVDIPSELSNPIMASKSKEAVEKIGEEWLLMQSQELLKAGVPVLHYYTLGKPQIIKNVVEKIF